jgi:hypothetical protein
VGRPQRRPTGTVLCPFKEEDESPFVGMLKVEPEWWPP